MLLHIGVDFAGDGAGIEVGDAVLGDAAQGGPHVRVLQDLADAARAAVRLDVDLGGRWILVEATDAGDAAMLARPAPEIGDVRADGEALLAIVDGGLQ